MKPADKLWPVDCHRKTIDGFFAEVKQVGAAVELGEYVDNLQALLRSDTARWRMVVERQVLAQVLPRLRGNRATLEPALWRLLVLCLDGHEAAVPGLEPALWEKAKQAAAVGRALGKDGRAPFPRAAAAVAAAFEQLRQAGIYPPPKLGG